MERLIGKRSLKRYLDAFQGVWELKDRTNCDVCYPIPIVEMNVYIRKYESTCPPPWFCEEHAREWDLLW